MSHHATRDFLRASRRAVGFSQSELATLLGLRNRSHLARIEREKQALQLEHVLRYEMLFGRPIAEIVPALCDIIRNELWEDITVALHADSERVSPSGERKRALLLAALKRIESFNR